MKLKPTVMKTSILSIALIGIFTNTMASPSTYSQPIPGQQYTIHKIELLEIDFNPPQGGNNYSIVLDTLPFNSIPSESFSVEVQEAKKNKYYNNFSGSDIVITNEFNGTSKSTYGTESQHFYSIDNGKLNKLGRVDIDLKTGHSQINNFSNTEIKMDDLMYYGHSHSDSWEGSFMLNGTTKTVYWSDGRTTYDVDGIGTVNVDGYQLEGIHRIKRERIYTERSSTTVPKNFKTITYEWWMPNVPLPIMTFEHIVSDGSTTDQYFAYYLSPSHYLPVGTEEVVSNKVEMNIFPNPANSSTNVSFNLERADHVNIVLMDQSGRIVSNIFNGHRSAGNQKIEMDLNVSPGMYLVKMESSSATKVERLIVN